MGGEVSNFVALTDSEDEARVLYYQSSFTQPDAWWLYDPNLPAGSGGATITALVDTSPLGLGDIEEVRESAVSKNGTRIPLNIMRRKGTELDGWDSTLL